MYEFFFSATSCISLFFLLRRVKLTLEGLEEDDDDRVSPTVLHKMSNSLEISLISDNEFKCRHSQPECGYGLQPDRWTEYSIQTMEPDNLELIFDFFEVSSYCSEGIEKQCRDKLILTLVLIFILI